MYQGTHEAKILYVVRDATVRVSPVFDGVLHMAYFVAKTVDGVKVHGLIPEWRVEKEGVMPGSAVRITSEISQSWLMFDKREKGDGRVIVIFGAYPITERCCSTFPASLFVTGSFYGPGYKGCQHEN